MFREYIYYLTNTMPLIFDLLGYVVKNLREALKLNENMQKNMFYQRVTSRCFSTILVETVATSGICDPAHVSHGVSPTSYNWGRP